VAVGPVTWDRSGLLIASCAPCAGCRHLRGAGTCTAYAGGDGLRLSRWRDRAEPARQMTGSFPAASVGAVMRLWGLTAHDMSILRYQGFPACLTVMRSRSVSHPWHFLGFGRASSGPSAVPDADAAGCDHRCRRHLGPGGGFRSEMLHPAVPGRYGCGRSTHRSCIRSPSPGTAPADLAGRAEGTPASVWCRFRDFSWSS